MRRVRSGPSGPIVVERDIRPVFKAGCAMKSRERPVTCLSRQAQHILVALRTWAEGLKFALPSRDGPARRIWHVACDLEPVPSVSCLGSRPRASRWSLLLPCMGRADRPDAARRSALPQGLDREAGGTRGRALVCWSHCCPRWVSATGCERTAFPAASWLSRSEGRLMPRPAHWPSARDAQALAMNHAPHQVG